MTADTQPREAASGSTAAGAETSHEAIARFVAETAALTQPDRIHWVTGSDEEWLELTDALVATGTFTRLNPEIKPNSFHAASDPTDVARVEDRTFICSVEEKDCGPTNNWMDPHEMKDLMRGLYAGCMRGRTMYVIPFVMGHLDSENPMFGIELTDSAYVTVSMRVMARTGTAVLRKMEELDAAVRARPALGRDAAGAGPGRRGLAVQRHQVHRAVPRGAGDLVLRVRLRRQRAAGQEVLRAADRLGDGPRRGLAGRAHADPQADQPRGRGQVHHRGVPLRVRQDQPGDAAPDASRAGRSRPSATTSPGCGWATTAGCGRSTPSSASSASRPAPTRTTNPNAMDTIEKGNSVFTNVALTEDGDIWWEGLENTPARATSWKGEPWTPESDELSSHANSRYCTPIKQCDILAPEYDDPRGVPIDAILFGGRRKTTVPLVFEARDWTHGTFLGATLSSETTAAATGAVGVVRRDPMAMLPFIGYNAGHYFNHWITVGKDNDAAKLPKIFYVNWFRRDEQGDFLWPGFGENSRVLKWVVERIEGTAAAVETPIGHVPTADGLDLEGLDMTPEAVAAALAVDPEEWRPSCPRSRSGSRSSATTCPPSSGPSSTASRHASAPEPTALPDEGLTQSTGEALVVLSE